MTIVSITADVEVDLDDVIEAASDDEIKEALRRRKDGIADSIFAASWGNGKKVREAIWKAIQDGDLEAAADLVSPYVSPDVNFREKAYHTLKRDPATGRPVIQ